MVAADSGSVWLRSASKASLSPSWSLSLLCTLSPANCSNLSVSPSWSLSTASSGAPASISSELPNELMMFASDQPSGGGLSEIPGMTPAALNRCAALNSSTRTRALPRSSFHRPG